MIWEIRMKQNPMSNTYFRKEGGKIQHYSEDSYKCNSCGLTFHPKVHSQSLKTQMLAIIGSFIVFGLLLKYAPYFIFPTIVVLHVYAYRYKHKKRKVISPSGGNNPKYGEIIGECTKCGSKDIVKALGRW